MVFSAKTSKESHGNQSKTRPCGHFTQEISALGDMAPKRSCYVCNSPCLTARCFPRPSSSARLEAHHADQIIAKEASLLMRLFTSSAVNHVTHSLSKKHSDISPRNQRKCLSPRFVVPKRNGSQTWPAGLLGVEAVFCRVLTGRWISMPLFACQQKLAPQQ